MTRLFITTFFYLLIVPTVFADGAVPVSVVTPTFGPVKEKLPLSGTVTSERVALLSSEINGLVDKVNVDAGDRVKFGDILIELDSGQARLQLNVTTTELEQAQVALNEATRLQHEAERLAKSKNIPETTVDARKADVLQKSATVATLKARLRVQEDAINRHTVRAPFSGVISRKLTEKGEWVDTGSAVLELVDINNLRLDVQIPQNYFSRINSSTSVNAMFGESAEEPDTKVQIKSIVPVNNPESRTFLVRLKIDNTNADIIPGMSATAIFNIDLKKNALTLPRDAVVQHSDGRNSVWIVERDKNMLVAREIQVKLGPGLFDQVTIQSGISQDSQVVNHGNETLKDGQAVYILEPN